MTDDQRTDRNMDKVVDIETVVVMSEYMKEQWKHTKINLYKYKGVNFADSNVEKATLDLMPDWEARADDVFIVSFPKSGTTWTQEIMYLALNGGNVDKAQESHTMLRVPYLEANFSPPKFQWFSRPVQSLKLLWCLLKMLLRMVLMGQIANARVTPYDLVKQMPSPRFLKSHLPEHILPPDIFMKKAKVVYVARNPKDVAVSFYHMHRWQVQLPKYDSWDKFFDDFMAGEVTYGHWYEHNLRYWKRRNEDNILFIKFEDMKKDEKAAVKQICEFLGYQYSDTILDRITEHSTFGSMKKNRMTNPDSFKGQREEAKHMSFMRKGQIGDWKNHFSDAQNEAFDAVYKEKLAGTGLEFEFE